MVKLLVYSMAQASKAIIPKDPGGPFGQRLGVSVGGSLGWGLRVGAYVTHRTSATEWSRYALVVLNCELGVNRFTNFIDILVEGYDSAATSWDPHPIKTTISFRDLQVRELLIQNELVSMIVFCQATYTFPVGVTTLWWYAVPGSFRVTFTNSSATVPVSVTPSPAQGGPYAPNPINGTIVKGYQQVRRRKL